VIKDGVAHPDNEAADVEVTLGERPASVPERERTGGGWLGIEGETVDGAVDVKSVADGSTADEAGIEAGETIIAVDGETMESIEALASLVRTHSPGDVITVTVRSGNNTREVEVTLGERPGRDLPDIGGVLPDIHGFLDGFSLDRLIGGQLQFVDEDGNVVTITADAGDITSISDDSVTIQPEQGDEKTFALGADARVQDGLAEGDRVVVLAKDGEAFAVISTDFSRLFPFGDDFTPHFTPGDRIFPDGAVPECTFEGGRIECNIDVKPQGGGTNES
jgi:hypothetical protein